LHLWLVSSATLCPYTTLFRSGGFALSQEDIDFNRPFHVGASFVSLAPTFFKSQSALAPLLLLSKPDPLPLGSGLVSFWGRHKSRSEEHTSELQSRFELVCRLL